MSTDNGNDELQPELQAEEAPKPAAPKPAPKKVQEPEKLDFDSWYAMNEDKIPGHHRKEIIKADFKGRGMKQEESSASFDAALRKYGVKLA